MITVADIPPVRTVHGRKTDGVLLLSWSLGNAWSLSMIAHEHGMDNTAKQILRQSIRSLVIYGKSCRPRSEGGLHRTIADATPACTDPPFFPLGIPVPEELYHPFRDPSVSSSEILPAFARWVTAFYTPQPSLTTDLPVLARRTLIHKHTALPGADLRPLYDQLSPAAFEENASPAVLRGSGAFFGTTRLDVFKENADRALFDRERDDGDAFGAMEVRYLWCDMSPGITLYVAQYAAERFEAARARGRTFDVVEFVKVESGNHVVSVVNGGTGECWVCLAC